MTESEVVNLGNVCPICGSNDIEVNEHSLNGHVFKVTLRCFWCDSSRTVDV